MYSSLAAVTQQAEAELDVRIIVILGSADTFTAGNDLQEFFLAPETDADRPVYRFKRALSGSTKIVVAGVSGLAIGIGTTLLMHCDLVVAGKGARLSMPFVDLGLFPEFASSLLFPRLVGRQIADKHLLLGDLTIIAPFGLDDLFSMRLAPNLAGPTNGFERTAASLRARWPEINVDP